MRGRTLGVILFFIVAFLAVRWWSSHRLPSEMAVDQAQENGIIRATVSGTGRVDTLRLEITSTHQIDIVIPVGTLFGSSTSGTQNMIAARTVRLVFLDAGTQTQEIEVYCVNRFLDIPSLGSTFTISTTSTTDASSPVRKLAACLEQHDAPQRVRQLAVWVVSDELWDLSPEELAERFLEEGMKEFENLDVDQVIDAARQRGVEISDAEAQILRDLYHNNRPTYDKILRAVVSQRVEENIRDYREKAAPLLQECGFDLSNKALFQP